jgi:hypothetical protein
MENPVNAAAATTSPRGTSMVRSATNGDGPVASAAIQPYPSQSIIGQRYTNDRRSMHGGIPHAEPQTDLDRNEEAIGNYRISGLTPKGTEIESRNMPVPLPG